MINGGLSVSLAQFRLTNYVANAGATATAIATRIAFGADLLVLLGALLLGGGLTALFMRWFWLSRGVERVSPTQSQRRLASEQVAEPFGIAALWRGIDMLSIMIVIQSMLYEYHPPTTLLEDLVTMAGVALPFVVLFGLLMPLLDYYLAGRTLLRQAP